MKFFKYCPVPQTETLHSTQSKHLFLWHEFEKLNFIENITESEPYIKQANIYFADAWNSSWRSAGLLYYYSFLNLAKAYLAKKNPENFRQNQNQIHGLSGSGNDSINSLIDFKISIKKPTNRNIFTQLYNEVTGEDWPHKNDVTVTVADLLKSIWDLGSESKNLFGIKNQLYEIHSILRTKNNQIWFEMLCSNEASKEIIKNLTTIKLTKAKKLEEEDLNVWYESMNIDPITLSQNTRLRSPKREVSDITKFDELGKLSSDIYESFREYAKISILEMKNPHWFYLPKQNIGGKFIKWSPLLSNYLFSFAVGDILRYKPQLLSEKSKDNFLVESWVRQVPITVVQEFLLIYPDIGILIRAT